MNIDLRIQQDKNDLSLSRCLYFLYAWGGGLKDGDLSKHKSTTTSDDKVCVGELRVHESKLELLCMLSGISFTYSW